MAAAGLDLVLAVMWHDPPWKPWGMMVVTHEGRAEIRGVKDPKSDIAEHVKSLLSKIEESVVGRERSCQDLAKAFDEEFKKLAEEASGRDDVASHEIQALVIPATVSAVLKACKAKGKDSVLDGLAERVLRSGKLMVRRDDRLRCADTLASAVDRSLILYFDRYRRPARTSRLELVSPFNPGHRIKLSLSIDVGVIAEFTVYYALALRDVAAHARQDEVEKAFRDAAFLLLEPYWLAAVKAWYGENYYRYIPPADTRLPTHTVFDHANAALAALLWCGSGGKPEGLLAEVDLAGVQSWIQEARRLRDLWAASWLASLLAWKAVEGLVDEHGPGVLVQPPARLHPFLAARLAGRLKKPGLKLEIPSRGQHGRRRLRLVELLGLKRGWPVDPTVPAKVLLALPPEVDPAGLREAVEEGVVGAWRDILDYVGRRLSTTAKLLGLLEAGRGVPGELLEAMKGLEPPLAVRLRYYSVGTAFSKALEDAAKAGIGVEAREAAKAIFLARAIAGLAEGGAEVKAPGRRLGRAYYGFYRRAVEAWGQKSPPTCTVCGRAPAVVDGERIYTVLLEGEYEAGEASLFSDVLGERLCPYCLVKRMLRRVLDRLAARLVGLELTEEAERALDFATIDAYTSRTSLARERLEDVASRLAGLLRKIGGDEQGRIAASLPEALRGPALAGNRFTHADPGDSARSAAESIIIEVIHDDRVYREAVAGRPGALGEEGLRHLRGLIEEARRAALGYRAKTALLVMDGDSMGKGVLAGRLGLEPGEYAWEVAHLYNSDDAKKFSEAYKMLVEAAERLAGSGKSGGKRDECNPCRVKVPGPQSVVVTMSYLFSVSRALAVQALLDRKIIERVGGMLIYAGGDDLLAVVPPAARGSEGDTTFPVIDALVLARRAYWGLATTIEEFKGFNCVEAGDVPVAVAPALAAHGRSGVAYIFDIGRPLWHALSHARELEELKDGVFRARLSRGSSGASCRAFERPCKDAVVVYNDSTGGALLPLTLKAPGEAHGAVDVAVLPKAAAWLASATASRGSARHVSPRVYYELLHDIAGLFWEAASFEPGVAKSLVWEAVRRHRAAEEINPDDIIGKAALSGNLSYEVVVGHKGPRDALASPRDCGCLGLGGLLALQIVGAARALHASV